MNIDSQDYNEDIPLSQEEIEQQVIKYETFIYEKLKPQLEAELKKRETLFNNSSEYMKLKSTIEAIRTSKQKTIKSKVELGCGVFAQANIPDTRYIYVNVGFGFQLQLTLLEALKFIDEKLEHIKKKTDKSSKKVAELKVHIQVMLDSIKELAETQ